MNQGILLNPNQALLLRETEKNIFLYLQKEFNFFNENIFFPIFPQIIKITKTEYKNLLPNQLKKELEQINIEKISFENENLFFSVKINTKSAIFFEKIIFAQINKTFLKKNSPSLIQEKLSKYDFSLQIKNFKICQIQETPETNSYDFLNEIWCKLK